MQAFIGILGTNPSSFESSKKYSSSAAEPIAVLQKRWNSPFPVRPHPSAIFAATDALQRRI